MSSSNSAPTNSNNNSASNAQSTDDNVKPTAYPQPWYPSFKNYVITNEPREGRYTKSQKRRIRASLLPVYPDPDACKDYVLGGKYAKTPEQLDAEFAEQVKLERAMAHEERQQRLWAIACEHRGNHAAAMEAASSAGITNNREGTSSTAFAAMNPVDDNGSVAASSSADSGAGGGASGGRGGAAPARLSYGGMRGISCRWRGNGSGR